MKPFRIVLFLLATFALLFILALVFPNDGIPVGKEGRLKFISMEDIFSRDSLDLAYTDSIIKNTMVTDDPEFGEIDSSFLQLKVTSLAETAAKDSIIKARIDSISKRVYPIKLTKEGKESLVGFFRKMDAAKDQEELVRVLHYGDSQIENDRMTSLIRFRLQKAFGGSGVGMVPAVPLYFGNPAYRESTEGVWKRYTGFGKRDSTLLHNSYGMLAAFTSVEEKVNGDAPSLHFEFHPRRRASRFRNVSFFIHTHDDKSWIALAMNDSIRDTLYALQPGYQVLSTKNDFAAMKMDMEFHFPGGGRIYGISFDPDWGIQVDNIAMRGSSGLEFTKMSKQTLDTMVRNVNTGLILMQFGGNVVPYINNTDYYKRKFIREISYLKELFPDVAILVIGPSDMSTKENGKLTTYPKLVPVRDALREAALETGCGFWDMYEAMGGRGSIQNFVEADPPLATSDYIHFTQKGANLMAGMFFDALMLEYGRYRTMLE